MNKSAQSLLDLFNILPGGGAFLVFKSPVSNKEARSLYSIWQTGEKDEYGRISVPTDIEPSTLRSLAEKKLVRCVDMRLANSRQSPLVEITAEGQNIIRDIILYAEKSAYEGGIDKIDYEDIYKTVKFGPGLKQAKVAFKVNQQSNWLYRVCQ